MNGFIYKYTNKIDGKIYIGQTIDIETRKWTHEHNAKIMHKFFFYRAIRKHGIENFSFEIVEECDTSLLNEREIYWIKHFKSNNDNYGYNMTCGGSGAGFGEGHPMFGRKRPEHAELMRKRFLDPKNNPTKRGSENNRYAHGPTKQEEKIIKDMIEQQYTIGFISRKIKHKERIVVRWIDDLYPELKKRIQKLFPEDKIIARIIELKKTLRAKRKDMPIRSEDVAKIINEEFGLKNQNRLAVKGINSYLKRHLPVMFNQLSAMT